MSDKKYIYLKIYSVKELGRMDPSELATHLEFIEKYAAIARSISRGKVYEPILKR